MRPPNIVVVVIDTLRADHLSCYGYPAPTSPAIDELAEQSAVFETAIAPGIPTMPSFTTLGTGLHPYRHGVVAHFWHRMLSEKTVLLPQLAKQGGYVTAAVDNLVIQGGGRGTWFARGYDHYSGFVYRPFSNQGSDITDRATRFVHEYAGRPLFLLVHYWDPHTPYVPRPPFDTMHYRPGSSTIDMADVRRIEPRYYGALLEEMHLREPDDYAWVTAQYDGEISQVDAEVGRLAGEIEDCGAWDDTIFVLMSDHGECFGEGDYHFNHMSLYDAVIRVALMVRVPGSPGRRLAALVSTEDVLPTLIDLAGLPSPPYPLTGTSLASLIGGRTREGRPYVVGAESTRQASLALRTADWKVIVPITEDGRGRPLPDLYGRPRDPTPLLFDLRSDPAEEHDLHAEQPARLAEMLATLEEWRQDTLRATGAPDPILLDGLTLPHDLFMRYRYGRMLVAEDAVADEPAAATPTRGPAGG